MEARKNIRIVSSKLCQPFWVSISLKKRLIVICYTYGSCMRLGIIPQCFLLKSGWDCFLLLNKQELMITSNITGSLSAVISMKGWVTEYLSMNKYYEGSPTLKRHGSFLIIRLLSHLLISIFSIFFPCSMPLYCPVCVPQLCMKKGTWGLLAIHLVWRNKHLQIHYFAHGHTVWEIESMRKCTTSWVTPSL